MPEATINKSKSRSRSVVYCAAAIACMAVTAWVTVPIGPVPISLAPLAILFVIFSFGPKEALISIFGYVLLGALGLPVFTGFRGGLGALLGPTGGFIVGYLIAAPIALLVSQAMAKQPLAASEKSITLFGSSIKQGFFYRNLASGVVFMVVLYLCGWMWLMYSANLSAMAAFFAAVAPFVIPDALKTVLAIFLAQAVGSLRTK